MSRDSYYSYDTRTFAREERDKLRVDRLRTLSGKKKNKIGIQGLVMDYERKYKEPINHKAVARLKKQYDIPTKIRVARRNKPHQPEKQDNSRVHTNVINREFTAIPTPYVLTGSDVTYIQWKDKWIYLSGIKDFVTGEYLAWNASLHNDNDLAIETLRLLQERHGENLADGCFLQLDQGSQYTSPIYQKIAAQQNIVISMSRKGRCLDNSPTESGWGHLKDWIDVSTCETFEEVQREIDRVVVFYNEERPQWTKKKMTPVEYRNHLLEIAPLT